jgi:hypothetical protein
MTVAIPCAACSQTVRLGSQTCPACGRSLSSDEHAALEARFEATNVDYRDAKSAVLRALAAALVVGSLTFTIEAIRLVLTVTSDPAFTTSSGAGSAVALLTGLALATCWFGRRRVPTLAVVVATVIWATSLALPMVLAPVTTLLGIASAGGVALTLVRLVVLLVLLRGISASVQMRRLLDSQI